MQFSEAALFASKAKIIIFEWSGSITCTLYLLHNFFIFRPLWGRQKNEIPSNFRGRFEINSELHVRKNLIIFILNTYTSLYYKVWFFGWNLIIETIRKIFFETSDLFIMQCPQNVLERNYENLFLCLSHKCKWGTHDWHRNSPMPSKDT